MLRLIASPIHILRGMGNLPHVGSHPGTGFMLALLAMGIAAGAQSGGWKDALFVSIAVPLSFFPFYAWGAYDRARISDTHIRRNKIRSLLSAYLATLPDPPQQPVSVVFLYWPRENRLVLDINLGIVKPLDAPDWLSDALLKILTSPVAGPGRHSPRTADLAKMRIDPPELSAHGRMQALGRIREAGAPLS